MVYHGRSREVCEWVIKMYGDNEFYKDHMTIRSWVKQCYKVLHDLDLNESYRVNAEELPHENPK